MYIGEKWHLKAEIKAPKNGSSIRKKGFLHIISQVNAPLATKQISPVNSSDWTELENKPRNLVFKGMVHNQGSLQKDDYPTQLS